VDLTHWRFLDSSHPAYDRPPDADNWAFALPRMTPDDYDTDEDGTVSEPLHMDLDAIPSADWYQRDGSGNTVLTLRLNSRHAAGMDMQEVVGIARDMMEGFRAHSQGPLGYDALAELGHPYGYAAPNQRKTWADLGVPRKVPRYYNGRSLGHIRGLRGSVPTMSVVNRHTGDFLRGWRWTYSRRSDGVTLTFWNERKSATGAPIAWFLAHGTRTMQAHGPWEVVPRRFWPSIVQAWRRAAQLAALHERTQAGVYGENTEETDGDT
jgi:hypothetical protein